MIKAVIFDMDGLLIDSEPLWRKSSAQTFEAIGISMTDEEYDKIMGTRTSEVVEQLYHEQPWEGRTKQEVEKMITDGVIELIKSEGKMMPGVHRVLQLCKQANLPVDIASSSPHDVIDAVVHHLELSEHFEHIFSAQFEPYGKPHPAVFLKVAEHFKVRPAECLVFEDSPNGVLGAKAAKMKCVAVPELDFKDNSFVKTADVVIDSLEDFNPELFNKL